MRFTVSHQTLYRYTVPVGLAPHLLRLNPRPAGRLLHSRQLLVEPPPSGWFEEVDAYGNGVTRVEFAGQFQFLRIDSRFQLTTLPPPPLPWDDGLPPLPWPSPAGDGLDAYRQATPCDPAVAAFAQELAGRAGYRPLPFLHLLGQTLFTRSDRHIRVEGEAQTPGHTLATWRGACRDLTVLFLAASRSLGLAGRFVSGYQAEADSPDGQRHLHAWPEIHLPGHGWRGWDPTLGTLVADGHVPLCAAPDQAPTMPVEGGFYANGVTVTLDYAVRIATG
jgi:transglutaminase-like putative cysteine protease